MIIADYYNWFIVFTRGGKEVTASIFTMLLLGRSRSRAPFWDVFSISVVLSLGVVLRLSNITQGGSEVRVVGRNTRQKRDNKKKTLKTILSAVTSKDSLSVKIQ